MTDNYDKLVEFKANMDRDMRWLYGMARAMSPQARCNSIYPLIRKINDAEAFLRLILLNDPNYFTHVHVPPLKNPSFWEKIGL